MIQRIGGGGFMQTKQHRPLAAKVSQEAQCQECDSDLFAIGSFYACQQPECSRYAVPVNEYGNTDAEQEEDDERQGQAAIERDASGPTYAERRAYEIDQYYRRGF